MYEGTRARALHDLDLADVERYYEQLLLLDVVADVEPVLGEALQLIVELTRARLVYLEVVGDDSAPTVWRGYATSGTSLDSIRSQISYGIVRRAIADRRTIETSSALVDKRFVELASVRQNEIGAVVCAPLGTRIPVGVVYLQGPGKFSAHDRARVEALALRLARIAPRLTSARPLSRRPLDEEVRDLQERRVREAMDRHDGNIAKVARELCVGRVFVYGVLRRLAQLESVSGENTSSE